MDNPEACDEMTSESPERTSVDAKGVGGGISHWICLLHPFDPRGEKVGGLETYIRDFIGFCPPDTGLMMVGVDSRGDLRLGRVQPLMFRGREIAYLPILAYSDERAREASRSVRGSITAQFFVSLLRHFPAIAREIGARGCTVDLRRVEFAWVPVVLRAPYIQMAHGEGVARPRMDSLLRRYRFVHSVGESFAMSTCRRFLCVNPYIADRLRATYPRHRDKIDTLWTWVNTDVFRPRPLPRSDERFKVVFGGRLDAFKAPSRMFRTIARLRQLVDAAVEFHYVGTSDPYRFDEFADIEDVTVQHGFKDAGGVADVIGEVHAGLLTSEFEGMPRFVLETLAVGRPVVAAHLPQLEAVIGDGSGYLVEATDEEDDLIDALARRLADVWNGLRDGRFDPPAIARRIESFTPRTQLARMYDFHRALAPAAAARSGG